MTYLYVIMIARGYKSVNYLSPEEIISFACEELGNSGTTLECFAGVPIIDDEDDNLNYARELSEEEKLDAAIEYFNSDYNFFRVFKNDQAGIDEFLEFAERLNIIDKAKKLVAYHRLIFKSCLS